jgi:methyltransferase
MPPSFSLAVLAVVLVMMIAEALVSRSNERWLRQQGALEPPGDVYATMRWTYPVAFVAMAVEGLLRVPEPSTTTLAGAVVFVAAKALKYWAIASLGRRWSFRVLVLPGAPLVGHGPYAVFRHPNYVGVMGELVGMALLTGAPVSGLVSTVLFAGLLWRRIRVEERALAAP